VPCGRTAPGARAGAPLPQRGRQRFVPPDPLTPGSPESAPPRPGFRRTLVRVLAVQVLTLLALWLLQLRYAG